MTYCVGLLLNRRHRACCRTPAPTPGFDNIACYRKMFVFEASGERVIAILTAGNLSVTQTVIAKLRARDRRRRAIAETSIMQAPTMLRWPRSSGGR